MNLSNLIGWCASIVLAFAAIGKIDTLQMWIWKAQARVIYESRTANWGSPRFFEPVQRPRKTPKQVHSTRSNINRRPASIALPAAINKGGAL